MLEDLLRKTGERYVLLMMLVTRPICLVGGALTIYYMHLATPVAVTPSFVWVSAICVVASTIATVLLAARETRVLRSVLRDRSTGRPIDNDRAGEALVEAMTFNRRHHRNEAWLVPATTVLPISLHSWITGADRALVLQPVLGGFVGIATVLMLTYFAADRWMEPVVRSLIANGARVRPDRVPREHIRTRMTIAFGLTIAVTAMMIGALANQHLGGEDSHLRWHTIGISVVALVTGLLLSLLLARSVSDRVDRLVGAMRRVGQGDLTQRVVSTGNDEIDVLARQFNAMVQQLFVANEELKHVNTNLNRIVEERTAELEESLERVREHDQLKTEFFSNVSHELRTPLQMILAPLDRVMEGSDAATLPMDVADDLGTMRINGYRLLRLIGQLLDFAKIDAGLAEVRRQPVAVKGFVEPLVAAARPLAGIRGLHLESDVADDLPLVAADLGKLETIVGNLLSNALKFTPRGGRVTVSARDAGNGGVRFAVEDTGIGIAVDGVPRIFERFRQIDGSTSRQHAGTGLGMPLAKEYVELHGGRLDVASAPGRGTRFSFTLPAAGETAETVDGGESSSDSGRRLAVFPDLVETERTASGVVDSARPGEEVATILVVDDVPEMRFHVGDLLRDRYRVRFAADGAEAFAAAVEHQPDVVVSDVMMPNVDGYELCERVRADERTARTPILLLTARAGVGALSEGLERGADDYLAKPFDPRELSARVDALVRVSRLNQRLDDRNRELGTALTSLRETQSQLVQSEKMRALGQLSAGVAHEINNAINVVQNGIRPLAERAHRLQGIMDELVENHTEGAAKSAVEASFRTIFALADAIEEGAARTTRIVGDLRSFSHPGTESAVEYDVHESLDLCLNLVAPRLRDRVTVERRLCTDGRVTGRAGRLDQVFLNVLDNAQQAIDGTGTIRVESERTDGSLVVRITDSGGGIPAEIRERIFDPFFTTKPPGEGTGLGLAVSYGIVNDLGGTIAVDDAQGGGTTFTIRIPLVPAEHGASVSSSELESVP